MIKKITLFKIGITDETIENILEYLFFRFKSEKKGYIVTPNPEMFVYARKHPRFQSILNNADIALPDGVGVFLAAGLMGTHLKERIPGVDFMEEFCEYANGKPISIGFLGGRMGVAKRTAECLLRRYPGIKVRWVGEEWQNIKPHAGMIHFDREKKRDENPYIPEKDPIDMLFVAFGFPKQEEWITENLEHLPVRFAMCVGGSFDYLSGEVLRAPFMIRAMGFEWLFRLVRQPWRIKRQMALVLFLYYFIKEFVHKIRHQKIKK
jgi:N-acetylglucosaminyldiphosphoundecaprenol N-acetyl-beta-D-mannosaminyltransferase